METHFLVAPLPDFLGGGRIVWSKPMAPRALTLMVGDAFPGAVDYSASASRVFLL